MTTEALSNIHRHTQSRSVHVLLNLDNNNLVLQVENETDLEAGRIQFSPSSIVERADALGGTTEVFWQEGRTVLMVEVPL
jgi:signal transduction histidine kinase